MSNNTNNECDRSKICAIRECNKILQDKIIWDVTVVPITSSTGEKGGDDCVNTAGEHADDII